MQKKLIALAVAGLASTGAFAQANVTVYGVADASFDVVKVSNAVTSDLGNMTRVSTNSSLIGFKGAEALGNGLTAVFQYESGVGFDNSGSSYGLLGTQRDSYVGVAGSFGTVVLGNLTGPTRALGGAVDVNVGATGIGANSALLGKLGNNLVGTTDKDGSYAASGGLNGVVYAPDLPLKKLANLLHPSERFLWIEENDPRGENQSSWVMKPGTPPDYTTAQFIDSVAAWHGKNSTFSWADGHAETHRWVDEATVKYALNMDPNKYYSTPPSFSQSPRDLYFLAKGFATQQNP